MLSTFARLAGLVVAAGSLVRGFNINSNTNVSPLCYTYAKVMLTLYDTRRLRKFTVAFASGERLHSRPYQLLGSELWWSSWLLGPAEHRLLLPGEYSHIALLSHVLMSI